MNDPMEWVSLPPLALGEDQDTVITQVLEELRNGHDFPPTPGFPSSSHIMYGHSDLLMTKYS